MSASGSLSPCRSGAIQAIQAIETDKSQPVTVARQGLWPDALDQQQLFQAGERAVLLAVTDDGARLFDTDPFHDPGKLFGAGSVDVEFFGLYPCCENQQGNGDEEMVKFSHVALLCLVRGDPALLARIIHQHPESRRNSQPLWRRFGMKPIAFAMG